MRWIIVISIVAMGFTCHAKPENIPIETVISNSELIVVAILTDVKRQESNTLVRYQGTLQVEEVLKGPNVKTARLEWSVSIPPMEDGTDHAWTTGKKILWLLTPSGTNTYEANYYKRVQDVKDKDGIKRIIRKTPNPTSEGIRQPADGSPKPSM